MTNNRIEDLVPPLELCKRIPAGKFEDSCFIWCWEDSDDPRAWRFVLYRSPKGDDLEMHQKCVCPAPTLAEILEALDDGVNICIACFKEYNTWRVECEEMPEYERDCTDHPVIDLKCKRSTNPAAAALRLFLEVAK